MDVNTKLCPGCMSELTDGDVCQVCGFDLMSVADPEFLSYGTVLAGRYVTGEVLERNGEGVTYLGCDTRTGI